MEASARLTDHIVETATTLFFEAGFGAVSIDEIAARASISKRTFYARFGDKSDLFTAVVVKHVEARVERLTGIQAEAGTLGDRLEAVACEILRILCQEDSIALDRIVTAEVSRFPELGRTLYDFAVSRGIGVIETILEQADYDGEIRPIDIHHAAQHFLFAAVLGPMRMISLGLEGSRMTANRSRKVRASVDIFLQGISRGR